MKKLIYVVEDESSIRELYNYIIAEADMDVMVFEDGKSMFEQLKKKTPDLFILDIMLDGKDGYEILNDLKNEKKTKNIPVIMVSAKNEEISKVKGLNLGADDYISKPFGVLELVARIKANMRKTIKEESLEKIEYKDITIDQLKHTTTINHKSVQLTLKEYNFLKLLLKEHEKVVNREKILKEVWDTDFLGETRTIDMHIKQIRKKLAENNSYVEIITVRSVGYMLK